MGKQFSWGVRLTALGGGGYPLARPQSRRPVGPERAMNLFCKPLVLIALLCMARQRSCVRAAINVVMTIL